MEGQTEFQSQGITLRTKITPGGQLRPWGSKFARRGEVKNGPEELVLRVSYLLKIKIYKTPSQQLQPTVIFILSITD
jgi:hypothetical protein